MVAETPKGLCPEPTRPPSERQQPSRLLRILWVLLGALLVLALGSACGREAPPPPPPPVAPPPPPPPPPPPAATPEEALRPVGAGRLPSFLDDGDWQPLRQALDRSRRWLARQDRGREWVLGPRRVRAADLEQTLDTFETLLDTSATAEDLAIRVAQSFDFVESVGTWDEVLGDWNAEVLVTGYYEPTIDASLRRSAEYAIPIYGPPSDLITVDLGAFDAKYEGQRIKGRLRGRSLEPYPNRSQMRGGDTPRSRVLAWARDPVELFFLEVQGSGSLRLPDGGARRIGWAGGNGRPYRSIGKLLIDEGHVPREQMSMQALRAWLAEHPDEIHRVLDFNESVVFFRFLEGLPRGSLGLEVTGERSIATDHRLMPKGALAFLQTTVPAMAKDGSTVAAGPLGRFVLNQDTGGAIRGAERVDFYWGPGELAAERAGLMKQPGQLVFLLPKRETF